MLSRRLIVSFVLLLFWSAAAVVWLGVQLLAGNRAQESQQLRDRRESASDRLIASLQQELLATERKLSVPAGSVLTPADDGSSLATLDDVIEFYSKGGRPNPYLDAQIHPLDLTAGEKLALAAFLRTLTGNIHEGLR